MILWYTSMWLSLPFLYGAFLGGYFSVYRKMNPTQPISRLSISSLFLVKPIILVNMILFWLLVIYFYGITRFHGWSHLFSNMVIA